MTGQGRERCSATSKASGKRCRRWPSEGATVCRVHGGASPQARRKAAERRAEAAAERAVATYGLPIEVSPTDALLAEVHRTAGHVAWLQDRIASLAPGDLIWGETKRVDKGAALIPGTDTTEQAVPHAWLNLYLRERAHLAKVCAAAISAGIEERRVKLAEQQGALLAGVIRGILDDLDLSPGQQARVAEVVPMHLRRAAGA